MKFWSLIAISLAAAFAQAQNAGDAAAVEPAAAVELKARLDRIDGVTASFVQDVVDDRGVLVEQSTGRLHLEKPKFRWEVIEPFPQIVIAAGSEVEIYDPDLEQLTQKTIGNSIEEAPLTILTNADLDLGLHFTIERLAEDDPAIVRYLLVPKSEESLFASLELAFAGDALHAFVIVDHTGHQTYVRFADFRLGQVIQSDLFELDPPPGTDVVRG